jgi:S-adenosylmethionine synthetase
MADWV